MKIEAERNWSDMFTNQRIAKIAGNPQKLKEKHEMDTPLDPPEGTNLPDTLILDIWPP